MLWNSFLPELPGLRLGSEGAFLDGAAFYRAGAYPFSVGRESVVLFRFRGDPV